jgi:hypothetical protein
MEESGLAVARYLTEMGIPLFIAPPDNSKIGFKLPLRWQTTELDPTVVDRWRPRMAICAVMGHIVDAIDIDPRNGGSRAALEKALGGPDKMPKIYGTQRTPSGGVHYLIGSLGMRSVDGVIPGVDVKAGDKAGQGRGFIFIAPTIRTSKETGQPATYEWEL